jgi:hypothetical protein
MALQPWNGAAVKCFQASDRREVIYEVNAGSPT